MPGFVDTMGSRGQVFQPTSPTGTLGNLIQISRQTSKRLGQWTRSLAQTNPNRTQVSRFPKIGQRPVPTHISEWLSSQLDASGRPPDFVVERLPHRQQGHLDPPTGLVGPYRRVDRHEAKLAVERHQLRDAKEHRSPHLEFARKLDQASTLYARERLAARQLKRNPLA